MPAIIKLNKKWDNATCENNGIGMLKINLENIGMNGIKITVPIKLKIKWPKATLFPSFPVAREAKIAVKVVPIFAPNIINKDWLKSKTPCDASTTTIPVVIVEDCKIFTIRKPISMPSHKLEAKLAKPVIKEESARGCVITDIKYKDEKTIPK